MFANGAKGLALDPATLTLEVTDVVDGDTSGLLVHDVRNRAIAHLLVEMPFGPFPMALGVLYDDPAPTFESAVTRQKSRPQRRQGPRSAEARRQGPDLDGRQGAARDLIDR